VGSVGVSFPVIRSRKKNLFIYASHQIKELEDFTDGALSNHREFNTTSLSIDFSRVDKLFDAGFTYGKIGYHVGEADLSR